MKALIDGDLCVYRPGFASQHTMWRVYIKGEEKDGFLASFRYKNKAIEWATYWGQEDFILVPELELEPYGIALYNARAFVNTILDTLHPSEYVLYFSSASNFRVEAATILPYKGHRKEEDKPKYYDDIKKHLQSKYKYDIIEDIEADDAMSIGLWNDIENTIIVTQDKDLNMVPGCHYNPVTKEQYDITPLEGCRNFYKQIITGDPVDNIPGLYKCTGTMVNKKKYLDPFNEMIGENEMIDFVNEVYDYNYEVINEIGTLLWMLQSKNQVFKFGEEYYAI